MPNLTGIPETFPFDTTTRGSADLLTLGTLAFETNGNEWVYLRGTASVVAGQWLVIRDSWTTKTAAADDQGSLAIAGTAHTVDTYGWFQIKGRNTIAGNSGAVAIDSPLYLTTNAGYVDDVDVAGDAISHAVSMVASTGSAFTAWIDHPFVHDIALD